MPPQRKLFPTVHHSKLFFWLIMVKKTFETSQQEFFEIYLTRNESGVKDGYNSVKIYEMAHEYPALSDYTLEEINRISNKERTLS